MKHLSDRELDTVEKQLAEERYRRRCDDAGPPQLSREYEMGPFLPSVGGCAPVGDALVAPCATATYAPLTTRRSGNVVDPPKPPTIGQVVNATDDALVELHQALSELEDTLRCVTEMDKTASGPASARDSDPRLLDRVVQQNATVHMACSRVRSLLRRLQL